MARRRLEAAIEAGKSIEDDGLEISDVFEKAEETQGYVYEENRAGVYSLQWSYDGLSVVVGFGDGNIQVLSGKTGRVQKEVRGHLRGTGLPITAIRFHPVQHYIFYGASSAGRVCSCSHVDGSCKDIITEKDNEINAMDFCLDGDSFATGGKDMNIRLYDTATSECIKTYEGYQWVSEETSNGGHARRIFALKFHPEHNHLFVTGGWDNQLKVWDSRTRDGINRSISGPHICGDSLDLKGNQVLTGSWKASDALQLWDFGEGRLIQDITFPEDGKGEYLYCAQFCDNGVVLAGGSGTSSVKAIHTPTNKCLGEVPLNHPVQALDSIRGGRMFAVGGTGRELKLGRMF